MESLKFLESWYRSQCNGDWEYTNGVKIGTLDNPGWFIEIDLYGTTNENKPFETIEQERTHEDWIHCKVENTIFYGYGGPMNLAELLQLFREYCE